jgi:hypothetical protein
MVHRRSRNGDPRAKSKRLCDQTIPSLSQAVQVWTVEGLDWLSGTTWTLTRALGEGTVNAGSRALPCSAESFSRAAGSCSVTGAEPNTNMGLTVLRL